MYRTTYSTLRVQYLNPRYNSCSSIVTNTEVLQDLEAHQNRTNGNLGFTCLPQILDLTDLATQTSNLQELVIHDCAVSKEALTLSSIPRSIRTLRISSVKTRGEDGRLKHLRGWFPRLVSDLDKQRSVGPHLAEHR